MALSALCCGAQKAESPRTDHLNASLISEVKNIQPGKPFWVALKFELEEGWHVNWKNPGDAGLAPTIEWELPKEFSASEINWPTPERIPVGDFVLFGYEESVLLPVEITPPSSITDDEITLTADCDWVVCGEVCVPGKARLWMKLPVKNETSILNQEWSKSFNAVRKRVPARNNLFTITGSVSKERITLAIIPLTNENRPIESMFFFPEKQGIINNAFDLQLAKRPDGYALEIERDRMAQDIPEIIKGVLKVKYSGEMPATIGIYVEVPITKVALIRN